MLMRREQFFMGTGTEDSISEMGVKKVELGDREESGAQEQSRLSKELDEGRERSERMDERREVVATAEMLDGVGQRL
jgi:hypothetical protein